MFHQKTLINLLILILSQGCWLFLKAEAGLLGNYQTSSEPMQVMQRRALGSGSRSSCRSNLPAGSITLLIPEEKIVHYSSLAKPSLFIHSQVASALPFKFTLVNPDVDRPIVEKTLSLDRPGIKQVELPEVTKLEPGKVYLWKIAIPCQQDAQEYQEVLGAAIERVPAPVKMVAQLQKAATVSEKAAVYAKNGFWYEAIALAIQDNSAYLQQLLADAGLEASR